MYHSVCKLGMSEALKDHVFVHIFILLFSNNKNWKVWMDAYKSLLLYQVLYQSIWMEFGIDIDYSVGRLYKHISRYYISVG